MSLLSSSAASPHPFPEAFAVADAFRPAGPSPVRVIRRNGSVSPFDASKIAVAMTKAFLAVEGRQAAASSRVHDVVRTLADALYRLAWVRGLKTTYYLRTRSATHVEKSTVKGTDGKLNAVAATSIVAARSDTGVMDEIRLPDAAWSKACSIDDRECEACQ